MDVVQPDLVTHSVLYTTLHPFYPTRADQYLQLAERHSRKIAGTQRRKLLSRNSTTTTANTGRYMFQDFTNETQLLLLLSVPINTETSSSTTPNIVINGTINNDNHAAGNINTDNINNDNSSALILFENENYIVMNKPSGTRCYHTHVTTMGKRNIDLSVIDVLQKFLCPAANIKNSKTMGRIIPKCISCSSRELSTLNPAALGIVHRLDRGTSGCIVIAKNNVTHAQFVSAFFRRQIRKSMPGDIHIPVHGRPAKSYYTIVERFAQRNDITGPGRNENVALIYVTTFTGRRHQVRIHCSYGLGTSIVGDSLYPATPPPTTSTTQTMKGTKDKPKSLKGTQKTTMNKDQNNDDYDASKKERFHLHAASISLPFDVGGGGTGGNNNNCNSKSGGSSSSTRTTSTFNAPIPDWWQPIIQEWREKGQERREPSQ